MKKIVIYLLVLMFSCGCSRSLTTRLIFVHPDDTTINYSFGVCRVIIDGVDEEEALRAFLTGGGIPVDSAGHLDIQLSEGEHTIFVMRTMGERWSIYKQTIVTNGSKYQYKVVVGTNRKIS